MISSLTSNSISFLLLIKVVFQWFSYSLKQGVENVEYDPVERVLGKALEKLLNEQKSSVWCTCLATNKWALIAHLFVAKEGVIEGFPLHVFWNSLVTTALTAELQAKENLQDKRELSTTSNSTEREKSVSMDTIYILRPSHAFWISKTCLQAVGWS